MLFRLFNEPHRDFENSFKTASEAAKTAETIPAAESSSEEDLPEIVIPDT